jgi:AefR-like transcriptional repressor, C-terminal domain
LVCGISFFKGPNKTTSKLSGGSTLQLPSQPNEPQLPSKIAGLPLAGIEYLTRLFDPEQMDPNRVITRDASEFPELGRQYRSDTVERRNRLFAGYLNHWRKSEGWKIRDLGRAAEVYAALLSAPLFGRAIHGGELPTRRAIVLQTKRAASYLLVLLGSGCL